MPKVSWCRPVKAKKPPVKQDYIGNLIDAAKSQRKMLYEDIAVKIGEPGTGGSLKQKRHRGTERFKVAELFEWFWAMDVGPEDAIRAMDLAYRNYLELRGRK